MKAKESIENSNGETRKIGEKRIEQVILEKVMQTPEIKLDAESKSELAAHIQNFLKKKLMKAKNRNEEPSQVENPSDKKEKEASSSEIRESLGKSTGRTQLTQEKRHKWIWRGREETNPSRSVEREFLSKEEVESLVNTEEMKGIRELHRNAHRNGPRPERGVQIGAKVKKKNRYSVPVQKNVFKHEHSMIEEESEDSLNADAQKSQRTLEESLKVLKGHLVHEIESQKQTHAVRPKLNLYSDQFSGSPPRAKASLDWMLQETLLSQKKTPNEEEHVQSENKRTYQMSKKEMFKKKRSQNNDLIGKNVEPQTRELFFQKEPLVPTKKLKKCRSLQKRISFSQSNQSLFGMSPMFNEHKFQFKTGSNEATNVDREGGSPEEVPREVSWKTTQACGSFQVTRKQEGNNVFNRLFKQAKKEGKQGKKEEGITSRRHGKHIEEATEPGVDRATEQQVLLPENAPGADPEEDAGEVPVVPRGTVRAELQLPTEHQQCQPKFGAEQVRAQ